MWKGSISFGLVTIPVKLYAATEEKELTFNLLHAPCHTRIQYRKWCPTCEREVTAQEIVKGYEYERGRYVILTEDDFAAVPVAALHTLEIVGFVRLAEIDPVYFERTYYLEPGEGAAKAYALLRRALAETGRIAVARVVIRSREALAAIRVFESGALALTTMHFPDEIRSVAGLTAIAQPELKEQEVAMAVGLVQSLAGDFHPEQFQNEYRESLLNLIAAKREGEAVAEAPAPERGKVVDLMEALRASIQLAEQSRAGAAGAAGAAAPGAGVPVRPAAPAAIPVPGSAARAPTPGPFPAPGLAPTPGPVPTPGPFPAPGLAPTPGLAPAPGLTASPPGPPPGGAG